MACNGFLWHRNVEKYRVVVNKGIKYEDWLTS